MTGYVAAGSVQDVDRYEMGCETKNAMAQMIARPDDLMGNAGLPNDDSRRQGTMVEKYKAGTPNPELKGYNASDIGTSSGSSGG
jgi:type IV pilus biogenesis protein CpaD/CtpE